MMHFKSTEVQVPAMTPEVSYWLSTGATIFRHRGQLWLAMRHHKGHRIMIPVFDEAVAKLGNRVYFDGIMLKAQERYLV